MAASCCKVNPIASRPRYKPSFLKGSISKRQRTPAGVVTVWFPRSTVSWYPGVARTSCIIARTSSAVNTTGNMPFWKQLL